MQYQLHLHLDDEFYVGDLRSGAETRFMLTYSGLDEMTAI